MKKYPYLMILKGKHGNYYFHVDSKNDFVESCRKIFNINNENRFYCFQTEDEYDAKITNLREQIIRMTDPNIQDLIDEAKLKAYQNNLRYYIDDKVDAKLFEMAKSDDRAMVNFVMNRSDFEYEKIVTETYS
jgi:hypothetical protein